MECGYPERFAQQALGHNSKAVHHAYAKHAEVTVPCLDDWEKEWTKNPKGVKKAKIVPVEFRMQPETGRDRDRAGIVRSVTGGLTANLPCGMLWRQITGLTVSNAYPNADVENVQNAVRAFIARVDELLGQYVDSLIGFRATLGQLNVVEAKKKEQAPTVDFDSEPIYFGWGPWTNPSSRVVHVATVGQVRRRNTDAGSNCTRAAQFFLILLYSFWEEEHRAVIAQTLGLNGKNDLRVPIIGDIRLLRTGIIHDRGILEREEFRKLEVLRPKKGIDLGLIGHFRGVGPGREILLLVTDIFMLVSMVRAAMDEIVIAAGGNDPKYRELKQLNVTEAEMVASN